MTKYENYMMVTEEEVEEFCMKYAYVSSIMQKLANGMRVSNFAFASKETKAEAYYDCKNKGYIDFRLFSDDINIDNIFETLYINPTVRFTLDSFCIVSIPFDDLDDIYNICKLKYGNI